MGRLLHNIETAVEYSSDISVNRRCQASAADLGERHCGNAAR
jgi:hypothetical protein